MGYSRVLEVSRPLLFESKDFPAWGWQRVCLLKAWSHGASRQQEISINGVIVSDSGESREDCLERDAVNATGEAQKSHHQSVFEKHGKGLPREYSEANPKFLRHSNRKNMLEYPIPSEKTQSSGFTSHRNCPGLGSAAAWARRQTTCA